MPTPFDTFGHSSFHASNRCHCSQVTNGKSGDGEELASGHMWKCKPRKPSEMQRYRKSNSAGPCLKAFTTALPSGKPLVCSAGSLFDL